MADDIMVTVDTQGNVTVVPEEFSVTTNNKKIKWGIEPDGWDITAITGLPDSEFKEKQKDGKGYSVKDLNNIAQTYAYGVTVAHQDGRTASVDPSIRNQPPSR